MILNYEFGKVSVAFFDDNWNEYGWVWKVDDFEKKFGITLPKQARILTYDKVNDTFVLIGADDVDREALRRQLDALEEEIKEAILEEQNKMTSQAPQSSSSLEQRLTDIELALAAIMGGDRT